MWNILKLYENLFENNMKAHNFCLFDLTSLNCFQKIHLYSAISNTLQKVSDYMYFYNTVSLIISWNWKIKHINGNTNS